MARPPPRTMTKEWQEATNEYLRVRDRPCPIDGTSMLMVSRPRKPTLSTVSAVRTTKARALYSRNLRRHRGSVLSRMNRLFEGVVLLCVLQAKHSRGDHCSYHANGGCPFCVHMHCNFCLLRPLDKKASTSQSPSAGLPACFLDTVRIFEHKIDGGPLEMSLAIPSAISAAIVVISPM